MPTIVNTMTAQTPATTSSTDTVSSSALPLSKDETALTSNAYIPTATLVAKISSSEPLSMTPSSSAFNNTVNCCVLPPTFVPDLSTLSVATISTSANPYVGTLPLLVYPGPDNTRVNNPAANSAPLVSAGLPAWISGLTDNTMKTDLSAAFNTNNGSLKVGDLSKMFTDIAAALPSSGLSPSQITDLTSIANNIASVAFNPAVEGLTKQLIIGNKSNLSWTNGKAASVPLLTTATASSTFGLKAGDTALQLNELNGKWFLGTDLPSDMSAPAHTYITPTKTVFGSYGSSSAFAPSMNDINQGGFGDCYFECTVAEVAHMNSSIISSMITDNGNGTYAVRFYVNGLPVYITVNKQLLELPAGYSYSTGTELGNNATYIWASLVEKAFAQLQAQGNLVNGNLDGSTEITKGNSYASTGNGGPCSTPLMEITGATLEQSIFANTAKTGWSSYAAWNLAPSANASSLLNLQNASNATVMADIVDILAKGYSVTISSNNDVINSAGKTTLVGHHALSIYGVDPDTNMVQVRNPWGGGSNIATQGYATTFEVSVAKLLSEGDWFYFVNASSPAPIVNTIDQVIAPATTAAIKGVSIYYSTVQFPNSGAHNPTVTAVLTDIAGLLSATASGNAVISNNSTNSISITGTLTDVNATLQTLKDNNPGTSSNTTDDIFVTVTESSGNMTYTGTGIVGLQVASAPSITVQSSPQILPLGKATKITGLTISDKGAGNSLLSVVVSDAKGLLNTTAATGLTIAGLNTTSMTLTGKLAVINTALSNLTDTNSTTGNDNLTLTMTDLGTNLVGTATVRVGVNPPSVTVVGAKSIGRGVATPIPGISIVDAASNATVSVVISNNNGLLNVTSAPGLNISNPNTTHLTLSGTLAVVNTALTTLTDNNPTSSASDNLSIVVTDSGSSLTGSGTETITVVAPPSVTVPGNGQTIVSNQAAPIKGLSITDTAVPSTTIVTVVVSDTNGLLNTKTTTGVTVTGSNSKTLTLKGTLFAVNTALGTLTDNNTTTGTDNLSITVTDSTGLKSATVADTITVRSAMSVTAAKASSISTAGTTIDGAINGDKVIIFDATSFKPTPLTVASGATLATEVAAALSATGSAALTAHQIAWFVLGGNTYLLEQAGSANAAFSTADTLVKLTGVLDLSLSTFVASSHTLTF